MARTSGSIQKGTFQVLTPIDGATETTTSGAISCAGAKRITWYFTRADHSAGSTAFAVTVSADDSTYVTYNKLISNVTNTNAQTLTRVASVTLSSNTTSIVSMDLDHDVFTYMKVTATETTDGTHTAKVVIEY